MRSISLSSKLVLVTLLAIVAVNLASSGNFLCFKRNPALLVSPAKGLSVLKADGGDPPPVPHPRPWSFSESTIAQPQARDLRVLRADGGDPPPVPHPRPWFHSQVVA